MSKKLAAVFLLFLMVAGIFVWRQRQGTDPNSLVASLSSEEILAARRRLGGPMPPSTPVTMPVIDGARRIRIAMGGLGLGSDKDGIVADLALADLSGAPGVEMIERRDIDKILGELHLSLSGVVRAADAVRAGKLLRADWFILGSAYNFGGAKSVVVRVVDSRSGILRAAGVLPAENSPESIATQLASFVQGVRAAATKGQRQTFLALGGFDNAGVNNRFADLPTQLRAALTASYQGSGVTMVEREFVEVLLREIAMDEGGLIAAGESNQAAAIQPAFWLVEGTYQSYERDKQKVELRLSVDHIYGNQRHAAIESELGASLVKKVKKFIDTTMAEEGGQLVSGRDNEARWQILMGRRLMESMGPPRQVWVDNSQPLLDANASVIARQNLEEASHGFESALLLEPTNREAALWLACCLKMDLIGRTTEARDLFRRIIDEGKNDSWDQWAKRGLNSTFIYHPEDKQAGWFDQARDLATNQDAAAYYKEQATGSHTWASATSDGSERWQARKKILFDSIRSSGSSSGVYFYMNSLQGGEQSNAVERLNSMLPELKESFPKIYGSILATAVSYQINSNSAAVVEFENSFDMQFKNFTNSERAAQKIADYETDLSRVIQWAFNHTNLPVAIQVAKTMIDSKKKLPPSGDLTLDRMELAYAYELSARWREALDAFETFSNKPVQMDGHGPWGENITTVIPSRHIARCREKLGLRPIEDPREFRIHDYLCMGREFALAADETSLWVAVGNQLLNLSFDFKTNFTVALPFPPGEDGLCLCATPTEVWVGSCCDGLVCVDRATKAIKQWRVKDGLLMDSISVLTCANGTLWIGYGRRAWNALGEEGATGGGGLGTLNVSTRNLASFGRSILLDKGNATDKPIHDLAVRANGDAWYVAGPEGRFGGHYIASEKRWEMAVAGPSLAVDNDNLFIAGDKPLSTRERVWNLQHQVVPFKLSALDLKTGQWRQMPNPDTVPFGDPDTVRLLDGGIWLGGMGYVAMIDRHQMEVRHFAYLNAPYGVYDLQFGGGKIWGRKDGWLFSFPAPNP